MVTTGRAWTARRRTAELERKLLELDHLTTPASTAAAMIVRTPRIAAHAAAEYRARAERERGHAVDAGPMLTALADALEAGLAHLNRCRVCGLELHDPKSVELGIGPTCRQLKPEAVPA